MKKQILLAAFCGLLSAPALADGQNNNNQNQSQAYGNNYSSVTQVGINNTAAVVQNGSVGGSMVDMGSGNQNQSGVNVDKQAFTIGSVVDSAGGTISKSNSDNMSMNNNASASIVTPLQ
ncbi:MAG: hypothetical protein ACR652_07875 [Methylocystis sp.]|uniref:hypothetical protein n=1 Tax=Methylocystis sp. TaxID=1911079 RepID=UPI003DA2FFD1